ncbi:hypothetical protein I5N59_04090 [Serratia marcescens]|nr:hypothetical protein [Serratia marcescens]
MTLTTEQLRARAKFWREKAVEAKWESVSIAQDMLLIADAFDELANNREAQPVAIVESSDYVTAAQIAGDEPRSKAVKELYEGALVIGHHLYTAPPAPAPAPAVPTLPTELLDAMDEVIRISDRDHDAWNRVKVAITAYRGAILSAPHGPEPDPIDVFVAQVCGDLSAGHQR